MENREKGKKLIISAYAPPAAGGSGLMMFNLLSQFPKDSFVLLTSDKNEDIALEKFRLNVDYYYYGNKFWSLNLAPQKENYLSKIKRKLKDNVFAKFFLQIILFFVLLYRISREALRIIKKEKIDSIVVYSDIGFVLSAALLVSWLKKKELNLFFYDMYLDNKMPFFFRFVSRLVEPLLFKRAKNIFVMCDYLQTHYKKKYGRDCVVVYNSIFLPEHLPVNDYKTINSTKKITVVYLGSVYWAQMGAVKNMINAVCSVDDREVEFILYTPHSAKYLNDCGFFENEKIKFSYCVPEDVQSKFAEADILFLGLAFDTGFDELINTSSPGKLCDYLISGRPILVNAPEKSYLVTYAQNNGFARVVIKNNSEELKNALMEMVQKDNNNMVQNAIVSVKKYNDAQLNFNTYYKSLN
jgi:hypothetical protein